MTSAADAHAETATGTDVRARIVEAAARLLGEDGPRAVTTRAVAAAAGVQAPTIYRLFGDKDGLVDAVAETVMAAYVAAKQVEAAREVDPVADLRAGWRQHVEFGLAHPGLFALLAGSARREQSPATRAGIEVLRTKVARLAAAGLLRVDVERAVAMIHAAGTGTVLALLEQPVGSRDLGLADAVQDAFIAAILARPSDPPADDRLVAAVVTMGAVLPELPGLSDAERALMAEWCARSLGALRPSS